MVRQHFVRVFTPTFAHTVTSHHSFSSAIIDHVVLCARADTDRFQALMTTPPLPAPPPLPPVSNMTELLAVRVLAAGGFNSRETPSGSELSACSVVDNVACVANDLEHAWIMWDLGVTQRLSAVRISLMPANTPSLQGTPTPLPSAPVICNGINTDNCVVNLVSKTNDGICDDGGTGSSTSNCMYGTDFTDCGTRDCTRRLEQTDGGYDGAGWLEIYVSRSLALFGTLAASVNTTSMKEQSVLLRLNEQDDEAEGRFVYIRSFGSSQTLRIDGAQFYTTRLRRRLENPEVKETQTEEEDPEAQAAQRVAVSSLLNTTKLLCSLGVITEEYARERTRAAFQWADVSNDTNACFDCVLRQPGSCTAFFAAHPVPSSLPDQRERARRLMEHMEREKPERRRKIEELTSRSCCKVNKRTGEKTCGKQYCKKAFRTRANERVAHVLRKLHDSGHVELDVAQRVATDILAPSNHHDTHCQQGDNNQLECMAKSVLKHVADKHNVDTSVIESKLNSIGLSMAQLIASGARAGADLRNSGMFKSDSATAEVARKQRDIDRAMRQRRGLRESNSRVLKAVRREDEPGEGSARSKKTQRRKRAKFNGALTTAYARKAASFAKGLRRMDELVDVRDRGPQLRSPPSTPMVTQLMESVESVVDSDGSVVSRMTNAAKKLGDIATRADTVMRNVAEHETSNNRRRADTRSTNSFFNRVDELVRKTSADEGRHLRPQEAGFTPPERHRDNEWISTLLDWRHVVDQTHRAARVVNDRQSWLLDQTSEGVLPSGELPKQLMTGIRLLDVNVPPSAIGNMFRRLHAYVTDAHVSVSAAAQHQRRMENARTAHRKSEGQSTLIGSIFTASVTGQDPLKVAKMHLENTDRHGGYIRRLSEPFLSAAAQLPITATRVVTRYREYPPSGSKWLDDAIRYVVWNTVLCNLYNPDRLVNSDGVKTHRTNNLCFPAFPYLLEPMNSFDEAYNLNVDLNTVQYDGSCHSDSVKAVLGVLGEDSIADPLAGGISGVFLRVGEGVDAFNNILLSGKSNITDVERAQAIVCAVTQLGGLLLSFCFLIVGLTLLFCAPLGSVACFACVREFARRRNRRVARDKFVDSFIQRERKNRSRLEEESLLASDCDECKSDL